MIMERYFHYPKAAHMPELRELIKAEGQRFSSPHLYAFRLYSDEIGCTAPFAQDLEFENFGEREKFYATWFADPGSAPFLEKQAKLVDRSSTNELWNLVE